MLECVFSNCHNKKCWSTDFSTVGIPTKFFKFKFKVKIYLQIQEKNSFSLVCIFILFLYGHSEKMQIHKPFKKLLSLQCVFACGFLKWESWKMLFHKHYKKMVSLWCVFAYGTIRKCWSTDFTKIRFLSREYLHVNYQTAIQRKC